MHDDAVGPTKRLKKRTVAESLRVQEEHNSRHDRWLKRGRSAVGSWRPQRQRRIGARRHLENLDNQLLVATSFQGLNTFAPKPKQLQWEDWRRWPSIQLAQDMGSDGLSAYHAYVYHFRANAILWPDPSHGVHRDVQMTLKECCLWRVFLLAMVGWSLSFGP